jgi:DNA-binding MarR family transcriptional regulator
METLELVQRTQDNQDRRQKYIQITPRGLQLDNEIEVEVVAIRTQMLAENDEADLRSGIVLLEKILNNARQ